QLDIRDSSKASSDRPLIDEWRKKLPESKPADFARAWWDTEGAGESVRGLFIEWSPGPSVQDAEFYPHTSSNGIVRTATQKVDAAPGRIRLRKEVEQTQSNSWPAQVAGVLVEKSGGANVKAYEVSLPVEGGAPSAGASSVTSAIAPQEKKPLLFWIGTAFLGGLILNLMPCVLPVIALKIFGFVAQSH